MNRLQGKRALITGGTTGIGLETARHFLNEGARVAITGRNPETLEAARKELGSGVLVIPSDAGNVADQKAVAETIVREFGALDVLFVNAGIVVLKPLDQWSEEDFDRSFSYQCEGSVLPHSGALARFRESGVHHRQRLGKRAYRHGEHHRIRRYKRGAPVARAHAFRRTHLRAASG